MNILLTVTVIVLMLLSACDAPRQRRLVPLTGSDNINASGTDSSIDPTPTPVPTVDGIPDHLKNCGFESSSGYTYSSHLGGGFKVCRPNSDDDIYIQFQTAVSSNNSNKNVCIFPTTSSGNGTVYIGEARCISVTEANNIYPVHMERNRPNYTGYQMSGLMIMLDAQYYYQRFNRVVASPDAYMFCMQWLDQTCAYGRCDGTYCDAFKAGGHYSATSL